MKLSQLISELTAEYLANGEAEVRGTVGRDVRLRIDRQPEHEHKGKLQLAPFKFPTKADDKEMMRLLDILEDREWLPLPPKTK